MFTAEGILQENIVSSVFSTEGILQGEHCQLCVLNRGNIVSSGFSIEGGLKVRTLLALFFQQRGTFSALCSQQRGVLKGEHCQLCVLNRGRS